MQLLAQFAYQDAMSSEDEGTTSEEEDPSQLDLDNLDGGYPITCTVAAPGLG